MRCATGWLIQSVVAFAGLAFMAGSARAADTEDQLFAVLQSRAPTSEKAEACYQLKRVGTARAVPALAALLADKELSHAARSALETMPYPQAGAALREALGRTRGPIRAGIIASLGARRDPAAVRLVTPLLLDRDEQVAVAAAAALGEIGTLDAAGALTDLLPRVDAKLRPALGDGGLRCARQLAAAGKTAEAAGLYRRLSQPQQGRPVRRGARQGLLQLAGTGKLPLLQEYLAGNDPDARAVAAGQIEELNREEMRALVKVLGKLPESGQEAVLAALTLRDDRSFLPPVIDAARGGSDRVRFAALRTLGRLGDVSTVPILTDALFAGEKTHDAARWSLEILTGPAVDEKIMSCMMAEQKPLRRAELIEILAERGTAAAVPVLLQEAVGGHPDVRRRAMTGLGRLAAPKDVPAMLKGLLKAAPGPERDNAEQAILAVCQQIPQVEKRADPILAGLAKANKTEKAAILPVLGRTGAPAALELIQSALKSPNPELVGAGVRALALWPNPAIAGELLRLAREASNPEHRRLALAGVARVATAPGSLAPGRRLALLKQAMQLAPQDDLRQLILERAALVRTIETLRFVRPFLDQPTLSDQACRTVVELAHFRNLRQPNQKEFAAALEKVIEVSKEVGIVDRARKYLAGL